MYKWSGWVLIKWDIKEWHVIIFAGWLFEPFSGLIWASDPALHLLFSHHHQAGLWHLPYSPLHGLAVALPGAQYLQGVVKADDHLISGNGGCQQGLWELQVVPVGKGLQVGSIKVYSLHWWGRESPRFAPFLIFSLITFTANLLSSSPSEASMVSDISTVLAKLLLLLI